MDGYVNTFRLGMEKTGSLLSKITWKHAPVALQFSLYFLSFALILIVAMINPQVFNYKKFTIVLGILGGNGSVCILCLKHRRRSVCCSSAFNFKNKEI